MAKLQKPESINQPNKLNIKEESQRSVNPFNSIIARNKGIDAIAQMNSRNADIDPISGDLTVIADGVTMTVKSFNDIGITLGINVDKLFKAINREFLKNFDYEVSIPLRQFLLDCGFDSIKEKAMENEEAQKKEHKRALKTYRQYKRRTTKNIQILCNTTLHWEDPKKNGDYFDLKLISSNGIKDDHIVVAVDVLTGKFLKKQPLSQYSKAQQKIPSKDQNAYIIADKMQSHYCMYNNQLIETAQLLRVKTLLNGLDRFTTYEELSSYKLQRQWKTKIKEPFEKILGRLCKYGFLESPQDNPDAWYYCHPKGIRLTDEEAANMDYFTWEKTLVHFSLKNPPDISKGVEKRKNQITSAKKKKATK